MTSNLQRLRWLAACVLATPLTVFAHPGDHTAHDAIAGFLHPLTGLDHVLAMVAVGLWAARMGRTAAVALPAAFPVMMIVGGMLANVGVVLPAIEPMIALSVVAFGVLIAAGLRLPLIASLSLVGIFAIFHGYAHVSESSGSPFASYAAGFVVATVLLHGLGLGLGWITRQHSLRLAQWAGSAIAATGAALLFFA